MKKRRGKIKRKKSYKDFLIPVRYIILLGLMFSLPLIYFIFTPLTIYSIVFLLKIFFKEVVLNKTLIIINAKTLIEIIPPCIAGSAYLLLLILNLSVKMSIKKRVLSIISSFLILLTLNILRILLLTLLYYNDFVYFDFTHKLFWYVLSTVFVIGIWFLVVKIFSIKDIPVYSDMKYLIKSIKR